VAKQSPWENLCLGYGQTIGLIKMHKICLIALPLFRAFKANGIKEIAYTGVVAVVEEL
jgi:hypothetical protein